MSSSEFDFLNSLPTSPQTSKPGGNTEADVTKTASQPAASAPEEFPEAETLEAASADTKAVPEKTIPNDAVPDGVDGGGEGKKKRKKTAGASKTTQFNAQDPASPPAAEDVQEPAQDGRDLERPQESSQPPQEAPADATAAEPGKSDLPGLREPAKPAKQPESPPKLQTLRIGQDVPQTVLSLWDEMMSGFSKGTRLAIWEQGLTDMQMLLRTSRSFLVRPKGVLTANQADEVEGYLATIGYQLPTKQGLEGPQGPPGPQEGLPGDGNRDMSSVPMNGANGDRDHHGRARKKASQLRSLRNCR